MKKIMLAILFLITLYSCSSNSAEKAINLNKDIKDAQKSIDKNIEKTKNFKFDLEDTILGAELNFELYDTYNIAFSEWQGKSNGATCDVLIKGDSITIINNGSLSGKKGEIIDSGILKKHLASNKTIVAHKEKDVFAKEIGGCSNGPLVVDLIAKIIWLC